MSASVPNDCPANSFPVPFDPLPRAIVRGARGRTRTGNGFYGGLQMNMDFQRAYGPELLARERLPAFRQLDLRFAKRIGGRRSASIFLDARNLETLSFFKNFYKFRSFMQ